MSDDGQRNIEFLFAAVTDVEGTIRATDTKASIALVLHGLIFSGLVAVTKDLGPIHEAAWCGFRFAVASLLSVTTAAFLFSVFFLLSCVAPSPRTSIPSVHPAATGAFFVQLRTEGWLSPRVQQVDAATYAQTVSEMDEQKRLSELAGEVLKLSAIRERKTTLIKRGLWGLAVELLGAVSYLILLGLHFA